MPPAMMTMPPARMKRGLARSTRLPAIGAMIAVTISAQAMASETMVFDQPRSFSIASMLRPRIAREENETASAMKPMATKPQASHRSRSETEEEEDVMEPYLS